MVIMLSAWWRAEVVALGPLGGAAGQRASLGLGAGERAYGGLVGDLVEGVSCRCHTLDSGKQAAL